MLLGENGDSAALATAQEAAEKELELLNSVRPDVSSILTVDLDDHDDSFVQRMADEIEEAKVLNTADIANQMSPNRQNITRDIRAVQQGTWAPPHVKVQARVTATHQPAAHCQELAGRLEKLSAHLSRARGRKVRAAQVGTNIFKGD